MTSRKLLRAAALGLALALTVSGCTINIGTGDANHHGGMHGEDNSSEFSAMDIMFAQMMIPHHQQAVDMGTLAETRAGSEEVETLAAQIKAEQAPEIEQMQGWLDSTRTPRQMDHDMGMGGMLTDDEMTALENSKGAEFDRLYLEGMIAHHQGAIQMAQMVINSTNAEVKALAEAIIESQTSQIEYMESLLAN
jgi:uncharacterized protein (DUF305 family)